MACYHPNKAIVFFEYQDPSGGLHPHPLTNLGIPTTPVKRVRVVPCKKLNDNTMRPFFGVDELSGESVQSFFVPCGQCIGCRLANSAMWADRCFFEAKTSNGNNAFVTFTYDDDHLPIGSKGNATLVPKHFQDLIKRVRYYLGEGVRFYGAGEYGDKNARPHYHALFFNLPDSYKESDVPWFKSPLGDQIYRNELLEKAWSFGFCSSADFTWKTAAYVARYCLKKQKGQNRGFYDEFGIAPEFSRCSSRPGIGYAFYVSHRDDILANGCLVSSEGRIAPVPRYFIKHLEQDCDPIVFSDFKRRRAQAAADSQETKIALDDRDYSDILAAEEILQSQRASGLLRSLV